MKEDAGFADLSHIRVKRWFFCYGLIIAAAVAAVFLLPGGYRSLVYCFIILTTFTTFVPGNVTYIIFLQVNRKAVPDKVLSFIDRFIDTGGWGAVSIWPVSIIGAMAAAVANLNDYHALTLVLRANKLRKVGDTRFYQWSKKWFDQAPFFLLFICNLFPLPVSVVRWIAVSRAYSRRRLMLAGFFGRLPRYWLTAYFARALKPNWWQTILFCVAVALVPVAIMSIKGGKNKTAGTTTDESEAQ